jgi:Methyltransferase domain
VRKIGGLGGGPKWTCDVERIHKVVERRRAAHPSQTPHCLIYSIGSKGNYLWEDGLHDILGNMCEIHIFDPDPFDRNDMVQKNMYYHQWGLGSSYSTAWMNKREGKGTFLSFQDIQNRLGHENRTIDLFKIDCEGCEWHSYKDWIDADLRQIMMETHELPIVVKAKRTDFGILPTVAASEVFDTFKQHGFVLYSKEVNTNNGLGRSAEWSFLKLHPDFFHVPQ